MKTIPESRTARLTVLVDPAKKAAFERLCESQDLTPSQVVRGLIRGYLEQHLGQDWQKQVYPADKESA
ncbi:hypothetical protein [Chitinimonas naiadis]